MAEELEENVAKESAVVEAKGFSITSMILGIVSLPLFCWPYLSVPCAILAIVFSIIGKKKGAPGMAITGLVLGIVLLSIWVIILGLAIIGVAVLGEGLTGVLDSIEATTY